MAMDASRIVVERRRWARIRIPCQVHLRLDPLGSGTGREVVVETVDISPGGLCFHLAHLPEQHPEPDLQILLPEAAGAPPLSLQGRVMRTAPHPQGGFLVSLQFTGGNPQHQRVLERFLESIDITPLLLGMEKAGASDLHLTTGMPPAYRIDGALQRLKRPPLGREILHWMVYGILDPVQQQEFEARHELDFGFSLPSRKRWRVNVHQQRGCVEATFRSVNLITRSMEELGLPEAVQRLVDLRNGLVLIAGRTGSGKSTTLAAMIEAINERRDGVVVTIEDPIEYLIESRRCFVKQREVGTDTRSFGNALRHVLRQDPDVILIGEIRDEETMATALRAAETGHLVLATLHTSTAPMTVRRVIDFFPLDQQESALGLLSNVLQAVVCQELLPRHNQPGKILATEVMIATPAVRTLIREGKIEQLENAIRTGRKAGMHTLEDARAELIRRGLIARPAGIPAETSGV